MSQVELPIFAFSRRRTRTYDQSDLTTQGILEAIANLLSPAGSYVPTSATTEPAGGGWKLCNGQALSKTDFARLYAIYGSTFGETATTFNLPDLRGKMMMGTGAGAAPALNVAAGAEDVTLSIAQLPAHGHTITDPGHTHTFTGTAHNHNVTDPGHDHVDETDGFVDVAGTGAETAASYSVTGKTSSETTGLTVDNATAGGTNSSETTGVTINNTGSGDPVPIIPPVLGINWLVRA